MLMIAERSGADAVVVVDIVVTADIVWVVPLSTAAVRLDDQYRRYNSIMPNSVKITTAVSADANRPDHRPLANSWETAVLPPLPPGDDDDGGGGVGGDDGRHPFSAVHS